MPEYHKDVPRDLVQNLEWRGFLNTEERKYGGKFRRWIELACWADPLFYINSYVWQFNPKALGRGSLEMGPFITWPFQEEAFLKLNECVDRGRDIVLEKSRDMGASWLCLLLMDWRARARQRQKFLVISRSAEAVDDADDPDSLFWKIDFVHRYLPTWLCGPIKKGTASKTWSEAAGVKRKKMSLMYEKTDSYITGEASTGKAGVGGRATAIFADEFSQITEARQVLHRTSDTTNCRIFNGTHLGMDTAFFELTDPKSVAGGFIDKLQLHWTQHPDKRKGLYRSASPVEVIDTDFDFDAYCAERRQLEPDKNHPEKYEFVCDGSPSGGPYPGLRSPWYDDACKRKGSKRAIAMDLDINPQGSVSEFFDALSINELIRRTTRPPLWVGEVHYNRDTGDEGTLVPTPTGRLKLWLHPRPNRLGHLVVAPGVFGAGADIANGTGSTPSCLSIVRARGDGAGQKVAEFAGADIKPEEFAKYVAALGRMFATIEGIPMKLAWEMQGPGVQFGAELEELGYYHVYCKTDEFDRTKKVSTKPGFYPSPSLVNLLLNDYRAALTNGHFENPSEAALRECLGFEYKGNTVKHGQEASADPSAAGVNHGDRVVADALAWKMVKMLGYEPEHLREEPLVVGTLGWRRALADDTVRKREVSNLGSGW